MAAGSAGWTIPEVRVVIPLPNFLSLIIILINEYDTHQWCPSDIPSPCCSLSLLLCWLGRIWSGIFGNNRFFTLSALWLHSVCVCISLRHVPGNPNWFKLSYLNKLVSKTTCRCAFVSLQAMIGVAFSLGFTLGPMIGAYLAMEPEKGEVFYRRSALLALMFAVADLIFIFFLLPETLPKEKRVNELSIWRSGFLARTVFDSCWSTGSIEEGAEPVSHEFSSFLGSGFHAIQADIKVVASWPHLLAQRNMRPVYS